MEHVDEHICFLSAYSVLVCRAHATGVLNLNVHLRSHYGLASELRKSVMQHCSQWPIKPAKDVDLPTSPGPPIEELGQPLDGLACKQDGCRFITVNIDTLRMHVKEVHAVPWKGDTATLYDKVKVQTFFRTGGLHSSKRSKPDPDRQMLLHSPIVGIRPPDSLIWPPRCWGLH